MVVVAIVMVVEVVEMDVVAKTKNISKAFINKINRKKHIPRAREVSLLKPLLSPGCGLHC